MLTRRAAILAQFAPPPPGMVRIPGGTFRMGSDPARLARDFPAAGPGLRGMLDAETPLHTAVISPFYLDKYEVTNVQFQRFLRVSPRWREVVKPPAEPALANHPVVNVPWHAAAAYAAWAGRRLPTEAEWEFAARGGNPDAVYPWGADPPDPSGANYAASGLGHATPVGTYPANPYGLHDMAGNVWEFCVDPWQPRYSPQTYQQTELVVREMLRTESDRRVIRGGSYEGGPVNMRVTARDSHRAKDPKPFIGFRCAMSSSFSGYLPV